MKKLNKFGLALIAISGSIISVATGGISLPPVVLIIATITGALGTGICTLVAKSLTENSDSQK